MKTIQSLSLIAAAAILGLTACTDGTSVATSLYDDATVPADVANIPGEPMAISVEPTTPD